MGTALGVSSTSTTATLIASGGIGAVASASGQVVGGVTSGQSLTEAAKNVDLG